MSEQMIKSIAIVTAAGAKTYSLGDNVNGAYINEIKQADIRFTGDPYDHYIGLSKSGEMLFSINCLVPCEVEYIPQTKES